MSCAMICALKTDLRNYLFPYKNRMNRLILFFGFISFIIFSQHAAAQKEIPELQGLRVHDEANILSQQTVGYLEQQLRAFEDSTTNQIAILIVPSLDGEVLETYSLRVAEKWKLGTKNNDNGVLLIVAIKDHAVRFEVGQGLEGPLPDAICNRIIRNEMAPNFRNGNYDAGIGAAVTAVMQAIRGEYKATDAPRRGRNSKGSGYLTIVIFLIFILFRFISRNKRGGGGNGWSAGAGFLLGSAMGRSGWGGGGGGGGGFSGGGGSFGGGGSSGSW